MSPSRGIESDHPDCATAAANPPSSALRESTTSIAAQSNGVSTKKNPPNGYIDNITCGPSIPDEVEGGEACAMQLQLHDGTNYQGFSFGARKSVSGELVFQTGMVGYPEAITDPSYRGQVLILTFPLVGNYGVPSRDTMDGLLEELPAHFEASQTHVSGLVVASYAGEDYSHHLATSSLGTWLKEQDVPAMYGIDTRALTKRIREEGSMLGRLLISEPSKAPENGVSNHGDRQKPTVYEEVEWFDPNTRNLVADGENFLSAATAKSQDLTPFTSLYSRASFIHPIEDKCAVSSFWTPCQSFVRGCWPQI